MIAVIFEVEPYLGQRQAYFDLVSAMRPLLDTINGFISIERFQSLTSAGKILSLSFWRDEEAIAEWRRLEPHRCSQVAGRTTIFEDYRLRIAGVVRDYGMFERDQAPEDSRAFHAL